MAGFVSVILWIAESEGLSMLLGREEPCCFCQMRHLGIFLASRLAVRLRIAELPDGASWRMLVAVACLGGIGFTMSLFVDSLALVRVVYFPVIRFLGNVVYFIVGMLQFDRGELFPIFGV